MNEFEEILKDKTASSSCCDSVWLGWLDIMSTWLVGLQDEYLVDTLRLSVMACAFRLVGSNLGNPSFELIEYGMERVIKLFRESMED